MSSTPIRRGTPNFKPLPNGRFVPLAPIEEQPWPTWPVARRYTIPQFPGWFVLLFIREVSPSGNMGAPYQAVGVFQRLISHHPPKRSGHEWTEPCRNIEHAQAQASIFRSKLLDVLAQAVAAEGLHEFSLKIEDLRMQKKSEQEELEKQQQQTEGQAAEEPLRSSLLLPGQEGFGL